MLSYREEMRKLLAARERIVSAFGDVKMSDELSDQDRAIFGALLIQKL
jgi:hypothetical protein